MNGLLTGLFYSRKSAQSRFQRSLVLKKLSRFVEVLAIVSVTIAGGGLMLARAAVNPPPLDAITSGPSDPPLITGVEVAPPTNLDDFVQDETALLKLGKALFWDMQLGSDGIQA